MAKDKKAKKGQGEETGEEVASKETVKNQDVAVTSSTKKNKKNKKSDDLVEDSITEELSSLSLQDVKKSKPKTVENGDPDEVSHRKSKQKEKEVDGKKEKSSKKSKTVTAEDDSTVDIKSKKKTKSKRSALAYDSDDENILTRTSIEKNVSDEGSDDENKRSIKKSSKSQKKTKGPAAGEPDGFSVKSAKFQLLEVEDDDMVIANEQSEEEEKEKVETESKMIKEEPKGGKKAKKKSRRKKDDDDEEDLEKLLEELALEMTGQKPEKAAEKPVEATAPVEVKPERTEAAEVSEAIEAPETKTKKKKKKKDVVEQDKAEEKESSVTDEPHTVKSTAEKKKEKKEREKLKRQAEFERQAKSTAGEESKAKPPKKDDVLPVALPVEEEAVVKDEGDDEDADDKKKKKKKKKGEEEKKDKKRPGKKQIAAMQEALKQMQEEEERLKREEEARIKAEEEAERLRQEKLRQEQEKKERKKQKEKEKRERLKAEGKLLTKAQRQQRARMEATLAALRQQGVEVPQIGEKKERAPRLGDRPRNRKDKTKESSEEPEKEVAHETEEPTARQAEEEANVEGEEKAVESSASEENEEEDVKDAWDETSDEENEKPSKKVEIVIKSKKKIESEESESEDEESESSEDSDDESESEESSSESETESKSNEEKLRERAMERIRKRREEAELNRSVSKLRSPVVCVLGHVDTGKTKILDKIRKTNVQTNEVGGITQQIGATMVPQEALKEQCKMVKNFADLELQVPGLLIIDTPGHESFSNLRSRGSSLCDIAILVVDIMHGLEPQTIESINLLKQKKTPFIVALNKIDRLYEWKSVKNKDIQDVIKGQSRNTKMEFDDRVKDVILHFANQGLNAVLYYDNKDPRSYVSMVPTSAITGDGMGNLMALVVQLTQSMMAKRLAFSEDLQATVLEVKAIPGLGTTVDVILVNGRLREGDTILLAGYDGPVVTQIRSLLMPQPLKELRVKSPYQEFKEIEGAQGVKITGKDLDKAIAGLQLLVAHHPDEVPVLKDEIASSFREAMSSIKLAERGVYVQASTLGSLEALLDFLRTSKIPYSGIRIGPVVKKDVMKASIMLEHDSQYAVILAFDVKVERDAQELADSLNVKIFQADIIYHLFDRFMEYREELKNKKKDEFKNVAVFPCKLRILPQFIFNSRDPIVIGVMVEAGVVKEGTPLCVPSKDFLEIGTVSTIEINHKPMDCARKGQEVCIKVEPSGGEAPKMYGRHFDHTDLLVSKITRQSIDVCKEYFRDDLAKSDWQLMVELKKIFQIL